MADLLTDHRDGADSDVTELRGLYRIPLDRIVSGPKALHDTKGIPLNRTPARGLRTRDNSPQSTAGWWFATLNADPTTHHVDNIGDPLGWCGALVNSITSTPPPADAMCRNCLKLRATRRPVTAAGECPVCGHHDLLRNGHVPPHNQARVGADGPYIAAATCPGAGQPPETSEPAAAVASREVT